MCKEPPLGNKNRRDTPDKQQELSKQVGKSGRQPRGRDERRYDDERRSADRARSSQNITSCHVALNVLKSEPRRVVAPVL